jgi:hypothetical protein
MDQRVVALRADHEDIAATAAVAARGTAARNELFAPKGHAAIAAVAGFDANFCLIYEHKPPGNRGCKSGNKKLKENRGENAVEIAPYQHKIKSNSRCCLSSLLNAA